MLVRIGLIAAALVVAACLALSLRAIRLEADARAALPGASGELSPAAVARAEDLLRRAEKLNPDIRPLVVRAALLTGVNEPQRAVELLREVLRREPENVPAASLLVRNLRKFDPAAAEEAEKRLRALAPPVPEG